MNPAPENISSVQLLKHRAYEGIKQKIISLSLRPNEQLIEQRLAEQLGISKSPIREAIQRLEREGLVYSLPFRGCFVAEFNEKDVREIFQLRQSLEVFCIKFGCASFSEMEIQAFRNTLKRAARSLRTGNVQECYKIDREMHESLISYSRNSKIIQTYQNILDHLYRYWNISTLISGRVAKSHKEHTLIIQALEKRDQNAAETTVSNHLDSVLEDFIRSNEFRSFCRR